LFSPPVRLASNKWGSCHVHSLFSTLGTHLPDEPLFMRKKHPGKLNLALLREWLNAIRVSSRIRVEEIPMIVPDKPKTYATGISVRGIGNGTHADGPPTTCSALLGLFKVSTLKFIKNYENIAERPIKAFLEYLEEVKGSQFPEEQHNYRMVDREYEKLLKGLKVWSTAGEAVFHVPGNSRLFPSKQSGQIVAAKEICIERPNRKRDTCIPQAADL
jgi:hypothetical protein